LEINKFLSLVFPFSGGGTYDKVTIAFGFCFGYGFGFALKCITQAK